MLSPRAAAWLSIPAIALAVAGILLLEPEPPPPAQAEVSQPPRRDAPAEVMVPTREPAIPPAASTAETVATPTSRPRYVLVGTGGDAGGRFAILREAGGSRMWTVRRGDRVDNLQVSDIRAESVKLVAPGISEEVAFAAEGVDARTSAARAQEEARALLNAEGAADDASSEGQAATAVPQRPEAPAQVATAPAPRAGEGASDDEASGK